ncbi:MAG TPA: tetratricopeptide repeat protein [Polyangiaceae bacterium]|jgi:predicted Zn-dependent protease
MSQTPTISQPPDAPAVTSSRAPPAPPTEATLAAQETLRRIRAELAATTDRSRQGRLLMTVAELEERIGDEPSAARDYLAAFNADPGFREPLEGLVRLLEKRRSVKNLGRLIDAMVRAATSPEEKVRTLLMQATYQADVADDLAEAKRYAFEATAVEGAPAQELSSAWLVAEVIAARAGDADGRETAFAERAKYATQPEWRALLLMDRARAAAASGQVDEAMGLLREARAQQSAATFAVMALLEQITRDAAGTGDGVDGRARTEALADAIEEGAAIAESAALDAALGDRLGVPRWAREAPRLIDAWLRASDARERLGQLDRAAWTLDHALEFLQRPDGLRDPLAEGAVVMARLRVAGRAGDTERAAKLAEERLAGEADGGIAAALAMRVAEHAAAQKDLPRALRALARAVAADPGCLPARAMQLDLLAEAADPAPFAEQLEAFAEQLATDEARGRTFLLAAYVWGARAKDVAAAKAALTQAGMYGVAPTTTARIGRMLAGIAGDAAWYEEGTKRLLAAGADEREALSLGVELVRLRRARGDVDGEARALRDMAATSKGAWLARALEAFAPPAAAPSAREPRGASSSHASGRSLAAIDELASTERDHDLARGLSVVAAMRALGLGDRDAARARLTELAARDPSDPIVTSMLGDLERAAGDHNAASGVATAAAQAAKDDPELAGALELEAFFERWRAGDRMGALEDLEASTATAPDAAKMALAWGSRALGADTIDARRTAIERSAATGACDERVLALERFALEVAGGDPDAAAAALATIDGAPEGDFGVAGALGRLVWSQGSAIPSAAREATDRLAARGPRALTFAAAEAARLAREGGDHEEVARAARRWFDAEGGLPAAVEWLAAAEALGETGEEHEARLAVAVSLSGEAREAMVASAAIVQSLADPEKLPAWVSGEAPAARLANLELSPPGCDPRRRATALSEIDGFLGPEAHDDAESLAAWSDLAAGDPDRARARFERAALARPGDLAAWEGLRACADATGDKAARARAAAELGARCKNAKRGAAFWEEAALLWIELGDESKIDRALDESFARDARRGVAFDKLFRRVRARKDNDRLLPLIVRRLDVADEPQEVLKLFWEQARVLREKGDQDAALQSLEHVMMLDPDHVGALALLGEINIRRGHFDDAATSLARLAMLEAAPAKNRVTAGVAAVDLYENKLDRFDKALEVLLSLHQAKLSTLPVRERLARAAARTGAWNEATSMLEELMNERSDAQGRAEAARLAMSLHRDRLGRPQGAAAAIVKLLEESPADGEALEMLLQTEHSPSVRERLLEAARGTLVDALQKRPTDVSLIGRLATVTRALPDDAAHRAAVGVLVALGAADGRSEHGVMQFVKSRAPLIAMAPAMLRSLQAPGDDGPLSDLFVLLGPTLAEALGPTLATCGVGRRDKVDPRSGLGLRNEIAAWAGAFGVREFDLYIGGSDALGVQGIPGAPPALVVGAGFNAPMAPALRGRVARELMAIVRGTGAARVRDDITIAAVVVVACKLAEVPIQHPPYAVLAEVERAVGKAIPRRTRKLLGEPCRAIAASNADARLWSRHALSSQDRAAVLASGDPGVVLVDALGPDGASTAEGAASARAQELFRFVLSPRYLELRRALGLEEVDAS